MDDAGRCASATCRCRRTSSATTRADGSRALPDGLRARARLGRRADRRPALHAAAARALRDARRRARRRSRCTSATARSSRSASSASRTTSSIPSTTRSRERGRGAIDRAHAEGRRVIAVGTTTTRDARGCGDARRRRGRGRDRRRRRCSSIPGHRVPGHRRTADELPPAAVVAADARVRRSPAASACWRRTARRSTSGTGSTATATRCLILVSRCKVREHHRRSTDLALYVNLREVPLRRVRPLRRRDLSAGVAREQGERGGLRAAVHAGRR